MSFNSSYLFKDLLSVLICSQFWRKFHGLWKKCATFWCLGLMFGKCLIWFIMSFISQVSLFNFCLDDLPIGESIKTLSNKNTVTVLGSICDVTSNNGYFMKLAFHVFGTQMFRIIISSWWIFFFNTYEMFCPSSSG